MAKDNDYLGWLDDAQQGMSVVAGEFVIVTCEGADHRAYQGVSALLRRIRKVFALDVIFVSQFFGGQPVVRFDSGGEDGSAPACDALESSYGQCLLQERTDVALSPDTFFALPVTGHDGRIYGTVCCTSKGQADALDAVARLVASALDDANTSSVSGFGELAPLRAAREEAAYA